MIEDSLPLCKIQCCNKDQDNSNQETKPSKCTTQRILKKDLGHNTTTKQAQLSIFSLQNNMKQYNPDDYMDSGSNYFEENDSGDCFEKVNENIFMSDFTKSVTGVYNKSDNHVVINPIKSNQYCEYAEKEKLKKIREELKMWKHEYLLKTGRQFVDPSLETSCGKIFFCFIY